MVILWGRWFYHLGGWSCTSELSRCISPVWRPLLMWSQYHSSHRRGTVFSSPIQSHRSVSSASEFVSRLPSSYRVVGCELLGMSDWFRKWRADLVVPVSRPLIPTYALSLDAAWMPYDLTQFGCLFWRVKQPVCCQSSKTPHKLSILMLSLKVFRGWRERSELDFRLIPSSSHSRAAFVWIVY